MRSRTRRGVLSAAGLLAALTGSILVAVPAQAAPRRNPAPVIYSFTASKTEFSDAGGSLTLTAKTKYASICKLEVTGGKIAGLPTSVACPVNQIFTKTVTVPANKTGSKPLFVFTFFAEDAAGTTEAPNSVDVGEGAPPPPITFTPAVLTFPATAVDVPSASLTVSVKNNSTTPQLVDQQGLIVGSDPSDFIPNWGGTDSCGYDVSPGQSCEFHVIFAPLGTGTRTATVDMLDASWGPSGTDAKLSVVGVGEFAEASLSLSTINWALSSISPNPDQGVDVMTTPVTETITNSSTTAILYIGSLPNLASGGNYSDFRLFYTACDAVTLDPGKSCTFQLIFDPTGAGTRSSQYVIPDNTAQGQTVVTVEGTGAFANDSLTYTPSSGADACTPVNNVPCYNFGDVPLSSPTPTIVVISIENTSGTSSTPAVTLQSAGYDSSGINPNDFSIVGDSGLYGNCVNSGDQELPGTGCQFYIQFSPITTGMRSAEETLITNTGAGSWEIDVQGTGIPA